MSFGFGNIGEDVDTLIHVPGKIAGKPRALVDGTSNSKQDGTSILTQAVAEQQVNDFGKAAVLRVYSQPW